jgi:monosaccharide-transporting ATPase
MDEPTSSLEPREVETPFGVVDRLRVRGVPIIYFSHRLDELDEICDAVTVLREGRPVHHGPLAVLLRPQLVATMLGREYVPPRLRHLEADEDEDPDALPPALEVEGLSRRGLLNGIFLSIRPGEVVGLAGLFGSGRTETGLAVLGAQRIDSGTVVVDGQTVRTRTPAASIAAGVALLPEDRAVQWTLPNLSIRDSIVLGALPRLSRMGLVSPGRIDALVRELITELKIRASGPDQKAGTLSGGNQQKVLLARLLCLNPKVLILDEPTRGIDIGAKIEVRVAIDALAAGGLAVLLISSETDELTEGSERIVVLKEGRVVDVLAGGRLSEDDLILAIAGTAEH